jgi:hypothetical protein
MLYLQTTQKACDALGIGSELLDPPMQTTSPLGNWMLNIVPIGGRKAFLFMSTRSLLSFPIMIGKQQPALEDMPAFLSHGLKQLAQAMGLHQEAISRLLQGLDETAVCKANDKALLATSSAIAADYFDRVNAEGGFANSNIGAIVSAVNATPRRLLGYKSSFDVTRELLQSGDA